MVPSAGIRCFVIALSIVIAIIEPLASGFSIHQKNITEKKIHLPVKNVFSTHNLVKGEKELGNLKSDTTGLNVIKKNATEIITTKTEKNKIANFPSLSKTADSVTTENVNNPTISSDTIEVFDSTEDVAEGNNLLSSGDKISQTTTVPDESELATTLSDMSKGKDNIITTTETTSYSTTDPEQFKQTIQFTTESEITSDKQENQNQTSSEKVTTALLNSNVSTQVSATMSPDSTSEITTSININPTNIGSPTTTYITTTFQIENETSVPAEVNMRSSVVIEETTTDDNNPITTIEPSWKKYITIERKRVTSAEDISKTTVQETMKAATSNTNNNFEIAYSITPLPSSEGFKNDLLPHKNTDEDPISAETAKATLTVESTVPSSNTISHDAKLVSEDGKKSGAVATKRGGFLNFSENLTTPATKQYTTSEAYLPIVETQTEGLESERPYMGSSSESQRQLAEDAIREELLREETISNNENNNNRYGLEKSVRPLNDDTPREDTGTQPSADSLRVQPINKTTLYTISPNYKPMKKIDVQPARPFIRDPDDNSWRNESISSLGIVFNPKNTTKSFKEVLKNKTQTELNNLQEKDNKVDVPDLRVRLGKIAEVRKIKKKKTNKNGEVVYTDYEEGSAENSKEAKTTAAPPKLAIPVLTTPKPITKLVVNSTPSMATPNRTDEKEATTISAQGLFASLGLDPLTTHKAQKFFDISEYYDTTDEYDADYVTMSKIDLKKDFSHRTTESPTTNTPPSSTEPMKPYFLDRKPTVQYFPPRTIQKVNLNNVDREFERKVNLFTFTEDPPQEQEEPRKTFLSFPPLSIAADKETRPTVKPTEFITYTPAHHAENYYATDPPETYMTDDENFNRGSYIIKHYRDFLSQASKDEDEGVPQSISHTREHHAHGTTPSVIKPQQNDDYDYDEHFKKDVLTRFVDNFNQNSERFKVDFPILYNSSVVHRQDEENGQAVASSRAFLKRLYDGATDDRVSQVTGATRPINGMMVKKPCEPNCSVTVELSPAYELHYYVPEEEEKDVQRAPPIYRLRV